MTAMMHPRKPNHQPWISREAAPSASSASAFVSLLFGAALAFGLVLPAAAQTGAETGSGQDDATTPMVIATINGSPVTINLLASLINQLPENLRSQPIASYYDNLVDDIIDTRLAADQAIASGIVDDPLLKELADRAMHRVLAEAWINQQIGEQLSEDAIADAYDKLVQDTESRTEIQARHILVATEEEAIAVIRRLDEGEDFITLAKELSTGPSGPNGGNLGYFGRGAMVPAFEQASFALEPGQHSSEAVQTQFGWHIIKMEDRRIAEAPSLEEARPELVNTLSASLAGEIIRTLRQSAEISRMSFEDVRSASAKRKPAP